jgi:hypothetical protein
MLDGGGYSKNDKQNKFTLFERNMMSITERSKASKTIGETVGQ